MLIAEHDRRRRVSDPPVRPRKPASTPARNATRLLTLCDPQGADIIVHSATKWIAGNGATLGGVVISSGKFPFKGNPRFPEFNTELPGFPGLVVVDEEGRDPVSPPSCSAHL